jgi:integrase/recombinase XerD
VKLRVIHNPDDRVPVAPHMGALSGYDDWMTEHNNSPNTRRQRMNFPRRLHREWGTFDVTGRHAVDWLNQYDGWTWHTYLSHMEAVYEYLTETGAVETSPLARLRRPSTPAPAPRPLTPAERDLVLTSCSGDLLAWCLLAYLAGLRVHEVAKIRGEDVTESTIHVVGKGRKSAEIPTNPDLWQLAREYPRRGYWFPSIRREHLNADSITVRVTAYFRSLGIETGSMHRLRHTFASDMARAGVSPRVIQVLMRHTSLETTMRYLEAASDEKRQAVELLTRPRSAA